MRILLNILVIVLLPFISLSQISVDNNYPYDSPQFLIEEILLDQCVNSSNHQFHGDPMQLGYFDGSSVSSSNFNFSSGILLATGDVNVIDPSFTGLVYPPPNTVYDPDLLNVANSVPPLLPAPYTNSFTVTNINDVAILEFDFIPQVLEKIGVQKQFHKIAQKPGKPMWFGKGKNEQIVFGLPGNPVSTAICLTRYVLPAMQQALGRSIPKEYFPLAREYQGLNRLAQFLPVRKIIRDQKILLEPVLTKGSGDFNSLSQSDGFVELEPGNKVFSANSSLEFFPW